MHGENWYTFIVCLQQLYKTSKYFRSLYFSVLIALMLMGNACAYLDPSVMTYAIQVVAGVIVAVSAVVGIWWRKAKKKVQDKLGIDENRNKEVEENIVAYEETDK